MRSFAVAAPSAQSFIRNAALCGTVLSLATAAASPARAWQYGWGHPSPQGNTVYGMAFADENEGWAVGGSGFVLHTTDGGDTWTLQQGPLEVTSDLYDVVITPGGALLACGGGGGLYRSTDGGESWTAVANPAPGELRDLCLVPGGGISAGGENGSVVVSADDGLTWSEVGPGVGTIRHHLWRSALEGYAVGKDTQHHTTDGGATWTEFIPAEFFGYNEIYFTDADHGYVVEDFATWRSADGGATWTEFFAPVPPLYRYRTLALDTQHWLATCHGEGGELYETTDAGSTWVQHIFQQNVGYPCIMQAPGGRVHWGSDTGDLFYTDDAGATIVNALVNLGEGAVSAPVNFLLARPDGVLFANNQPTMSGDPTSWLRSDDGGRTWSEPAVGPGLRWIYHGAFLDNAHGMVAYGQDVRVTEDGGETWQAATLPSDYNPNEISLPALDRWFIAAWRSSGGGALLRSTDQGLTWNTAAGGLPVGTLTFNAVGFPTATTGYAAAGSQTGVPHLYRTLDGGATWTEIATSGLSAPILAVAWLDSQTAAGCTSWSSTAMVRTTDGGATWTQTGTLQARSIVFRDAQEGVAIGQWQTALLHTTDGGASWNEVQPPMSGPFPGLYDYTTAAVPTDAGWVLGGGRNRIMLAVSEATAGVGGEEAEDFVAAGATPAGGPRVTAAPNPFNPATAISFRIGAAGPVRVVVYDAGGRRVRTLLQDVLTAGEHVVRWDGRDEEGTRVASGVYPVRVETAAGYASAKLVVTR